MAATKKLMYMFARIEDDKLVVDPDRIGREFGFFDDLADDWDSFVTPLLKEQENIASDWVFLVHESPIRYAPHSTVWDRVATDSVEYFAGKWTNWEDGPFPAPLPASGHISLFLVPLSQYQQLKKRDKLTEIRMKNISKRPERTPSSGGKSSTFMKDNNSAPLAIGRPKKNDFYPIPLSLLQGEFAQFKQDIVSGPLDQELSALAHRWRDELSEYFSIESLREAKFHELLSKLLDGLNVSKKEFGNFTTDGGVDLADVIELFMAPLLVKVKVELTQGSTDALFETVLLYLEGARLILSDDAFKGDWRKTRLPSLLIIHNGPNIQAMGAVNTSETYVEPLSPSIPLYFNEFDTASMENLIRFMTALRRLFRSLYAIYQKPNDHAVDYDQVTFPYVRSYKSFSGTVVPFKYIERVSQIRLVFTACTEDGRKIIVKFGYGRYGVDAHKAAAQSGLAPALLSHTDLTGSWWMVVMQTLEDDFKPCDELDNLEQPCKDAIEEALYTFHKLGFVHGDLRDTNVFVRFYNDRWECQLIDFDWAGREGEVMYPIGVYSTTDVWRPECYMDGKLITSDHDKRTVKEFLFRRTKHNRFR